MNPGTPILEAPVPTGAGDQHMVLNMGPQHPSMHGVLRLVVEIDGEIVVRLYPEIGYLHTGIEKTCEAKFYQQVVPLTDRIDYLSPMANNLCYCLAVERLIGLEIPAKAQWMRVLLAELTRLNSHLIWLGTHAMDIGALTVFLYTFREREEILRIFEGISGQRMMTSYFRIGGLSMEPPLDFFDRVQDFIRSFPGKDRRVRESAYRQSYLQGPLAGGGRSLRRRRHRAGRDRAEYARFRSGFRSAPRYALLRLRELSIQSADCHRGRLLGALCHSAAGDARERGIIQQALDGMPEGPIKADAPKIVLPDREKMKTQMEALIHHFKIVTEGFAVPAGEVYQGIESPRGQMGYYVVSDGTAKPYRVHFRNPSFATLQALETMCKGRMLADVVAVVGSIDIVLGEIDR